MRVLLLGRTGQLGRALQRTLARRAELIALDRAGCDLADPEAVRATVAAARPDVIVNAAAYTAVDRAESDAATAIAVNARSPGVIGEVAAGLGALVIHYSTDYVFDGTKATPYTEDDATAPLSVYGRSKRDGERLLAASGAAYLTFRTSWVMGPDGANFARTMLRLAAERDRLAVVADQHGVPTPTSLLAEITAELIARWGRGAPLPLGLYHLVPSGATTWYDYARFVLAAAERAGRPLKVAASAVTPITSAEYPTPARRPLNSRLATERFQAAFGLPLPSWQQGLTDVLVDLLETP